VLWAIGLPSTLENRDVDALSEGLRIAASELGAPIVGGNLARGPTLTLSTTLLGRARVPLRRDGAKVVRAKQPVRLMEAAVRGMLPKSKLGDAMFREANLKCAIFRGCRAHGVVFDGADLRGARFEGEVL